jgi:hypothetical protein
VANAVGDRRNVDCVQILDETWMSGFAVERLKATGETAGEQERSGDGEDFRPRH